jgi:hypothetical protein
MSRPRKSFNEDGKSDIVNLYLYPLISHDR